jgi:hypothetical protein
MVDGTGADLSETGDLSNRTWSYAVSIPVIPIVNLGLSPALQFMILLLVIYIFSLKHLAILMNSH